MPLRALYWLTAGDWERMLGNANDWERMLGMRGCNLSRSGLLSALETHPCSHGMYDRLWFGSMDDTVNQHALFCVQCDMLVDDVWCDNWII